MFPPTYPTGYPDLNKAINICNHLFVYGTLKAGYGNNRLLSDATFIGKAVLKTLEYKLVDLGSFPAIVYENRSITQANEIHGEVYRIDKEHLRSTDLLEGFPDLYDRTIQTVTLTRKTWKSNPSTYNCWTYIIKNLQRTHITDIPNGNWTS